MGQKFDLWPEGGGFTPIYILKQLGVVTGIPTSRQLSKTCVLNFKFEWNDRRIKVSANVLVWPTKIVQLHKYPVKYNNLVFNKNGLQQKFYKKWFNELQKTYPLVCPSFLLDRKIYIGWWWKNMKATDLSSNYCWEFHKNFMWKERNAINIANCRKTWIGSDKVFSVCEVRFLFKVKTTK